MDDFLDFANRHGLQPDIPQPVLTSEQTEALEEAAKDIQEKAATLPRLGQGMPQAGQAVTEDNVDYLPGLVEQYGDFKLLVRWSGSRWLMPASVWARQYAMLINRKAEAMPSEYLRDVTVAPLPPEMPAFAQEAEQAQPDPLSPEQAVNVAQAAIAAAVHDFTFDNEARTLVDYTEPGPIEVKAKGSRNKYQLGGEIFADVAAEDRERFQEVAGAVMDELRKVVTDYRKQGDMPGRADLANAMGEILIQRAAAYWRDMSGQGVEMSLTDFVDDFFFREDEAGQRQFRVTDTKPDVGVPLAAVGTADIRNIDTAVEGLHRLFRSLWVAPREAGSVEAPRVAVLTHEFGHVGLAFLERFHPEQFQTLADHFGAVDQDGTPRNLAQWGDAEEQAIALFQRLQVDGSLGQVGQADTALRRAYGTFKTILSDIYQAVRGWALRVMGEDPASTPAPVLQAARMALGLDPSQQAENLMRALDQAETAADVPPRNQLDHFVIDENGHPRLEVLDAVLDDVQKVALKESLFRGDLGDVQRHLGVADAEKAATRRRSIGHLIRDLDGRADMTPGNSMEGTFWRRLAHGFSIVNVLPHDSSMFLPMFRLAKDILNSRNKGREMARDMTKRILGGIHPDVAELLLELFFEEVHFYARPRMGFRPNDVDMAMPKTVRTNIDSRGVMYSDQDRPPVARTPEAVQQRIYALETLLFKRDKHVQAYSQVKQLMGFARKMMEMSGDLDPNNTDFVYMHFAREVVGGALGKQDKWEKLKAEAAELFKSIPKLGEQPVHEGMARFTQSKGHLKMRETGYSFAPRDKKITLWTSLENYMTNYFANHYAYQQIYQFMYEFGMTPQELEVARASGTDVSDMRPVNLETLVDQFAGENRHATTFSNVRRLHSFADADSEASKWVDEYANGLVALGVEEGEASRRAFAQFCHQNPFGGRDAQPMTPEEMTSFAGMDPGEIVDLQGQARRLMDQFVKRVEDLRIETRNYERLHGATLEDLLGRLSGRPGVSEELQTMFRNYAEQGVSARLEADGLREAASFYGVDVWDDREFYVHRTVVDQMKEFGKRRKVHAGSQLVSMSHALFAMNVLFNQGLTFFSRNLVSDNSWAAMMHGHFYRDVLKGEGYVQNAARMLLDLVMAGQMDPRLQAMIDSNQLSIGRAGEVLGDVTSQVMGQLAEGPISPSHGEAVSRAMWMQFLASQAGWSPDELGDPRVSSEVKGALASTGGKRWLVPTVLGLNPHGLWDVAQGGFEASSKMPTATWKKIPSIAWLLPANPRNWIHASKAMNEGREVLQRVALSMWLQDQIEKGEWTQQVFGYADARRLSIEMDRLGAGTIEQDPASGEHVLKILPERFAALPANKKWWITTYISSEAFGDYEDVGPWDRTMKAFMPFWQYRKINARRYVHAARNYRRQYGRAEGYTRLAGRLAVPILGMKAAQLMMEGWKGRKREEDDKRTFYEEVGYDRASFQNELVYLPLVRLDRDQYGFNFAVGQVEDLSVLGVDRAIKAALDQTFGVVPDQFADRGILTHLAREWMAGSWKWTEFQLSPVWRGFWSVARYLKAETHEEYEAGRDARKLAMNSLGSTWSKGFRGVYQAFWNMQNIGMVGGAPGRMIEDAAWNYTSLKKHDRVRLLSDRFRYVTLKKGTFDDTPTDDQRKIWAVKRQFLDALYHNDRDMARQSFEVLTRLDLRESDEGSWQKQLVRYIRYRQPKHMWEGVHQGKTDEEYVAWRNELGRVDKMNLTGAYMYYDTMATNAADVFFRGDSARQQKWKSKMMPKRKAY